MKRKIVSDLAYAFSDVLLMSVVGYALYIIVGSKFLSPIQYGLFMTIIGIFQVVSPLTSLGLNESLARFIPTISRDTANSYIRFAYKKVMITSGIVSLLILTYSILSQDYIYITLAVLVFIGTPYVLGRGIFQGFHEFKQVFFVDIIAHGARLVVPIVLLIMGYGVVGALSGWIVCHIIFNIFTIARYWKRSPTKPIDKGLMMYGITSALSASAIWVLMQTGVIALQLSDKVASGYFAVAVVLGQVILFLPEAMSFVILPHISKLFSQNNMKKTQSIIYSSIKDLTLILFPMLLTLIYFSREIILLIYNVQYVPASAFILPYVLGMALFGVSLIILNVLYAAGHPKLRLNIMLFATGLNVVLSAISIIYLNSLWVAYSFLISQTVMLAASLIMCYKKTNIHTMWLGIILKMLPAMIVYSVLIYLVKWINVNTAYTIMLLIVSGIVYLTVAYLMKIIDKNDIASINMILKRK